jgi:hypothetical protein
MDVALECRYMNQDLLNPPSVEGWHTGKEWIDSGSMVERINFVADELGNSNHPGIRTIIDRVVGQRRVISPSWIVDGCLEQLGCIELRDDNRIALIAQAGEALGAAEASIDTPVGRESVESAILNTLKMIGSTREYQFA